MAITIPLLPLLISATVAAASPPDTLLLARFAPDSDLTLAPLDTPVTRRRHAIQYSEWYSRRLLVHRIGSYTMIPMFAAEWSLGQNLLQDRDPPSWMKGTHQAVAWGIAGLFTVNTITGVWNLYDSRQDPAGRTRRILHAVAMLGSDAGFAWAGISSNDAAQSRANADHHRAIALGSIGLSTAGTVMMWLWRD